MSTPLVTALIPSRNRPQRLDISIRSLFATAPEDAFDVIVRLDQDEPKFDDYRAVIGQYRNVYLEIGDRKNGWYSCHEFYSEMADKTKAPWIMLWNDDVTLEGRWWIDQLRTVPVTGFIVQQEIHKLGQAEYRRVEGGPFPIVPNGCWKVFGCPTLPPDPDKALDDLLRRNHGWKTLWLEGVALNHQRDNDTELAEHRKL